MTTPTKTGWYWAQWKWEDNDGNLKPHEPGWEIVRFETEPEPRVWTIGNEDTFLPDDDFWWREPVEPIEVPQ